MKQFLIRIMNMYIGLFCFALGIVLTIKANIGYAPWDVLHAGIAGKIGSSIGTVSIGVGLLVVLIVLLCREKLGLGTVSNMIFVGLFINFIFYTNLIPTPNSLIIAIPVLISGLFIMAFGTYFYIRSGFGAGPRDSLMVILTRKTKLPVGLCRGIIELLATASGWLLGGMVGLGTVICVILIGFCIQIVFKIFKFDATSIKHETLAATFVTLKKAISGN